MNTTTKLSFSEAIDSFLIYLTYERGLSKNWELLNRRLLGKLSSWLQAQGTSDPREVQRDQLTDYLYEQKKRGLAPASLKQEVAVMKGFFKFLHSRFGAYDPAEIFRMPPAKSPLPRTLNQEEVNRLLAIELSQHRLLFKSGRLWHCQYRTPEGRVARRSTGQTDRAKAWEFSKNFVYCESNHSGSVVSGRFQEEKLQRRYPRRDRAILEVLYSCGLRATELCTLQLTNVRLEDRIMWVTGKGNKPRRVIVGRKACEAIRSYIADERAWLLRAPMGKPTKDRPELFLSERRGGPLTYQRIFQLVTELARLAGFDKEVCPHLLRHSFATHLHDGGADILVIKELLGHASVTTTQIYVKVSAEHLQAEYKERFPRSGYFKGGASKEPKPIAVATALTSAYNFPTLPPTTK
jgi:integrase/recombinase XerD